MSEHVSAQVNRVSVQASIQVNVRARNCEYMCWDMCRQYLMVFWDSHIWLITACLNWMNTRYIYKIRVNYSPGCWNLTLHIVWSHTCWVNMNFSKFISLLFPNWKTWLRSVFCACVYFLRIYSPSFCSFVSIHVLYRSSMFFLQMVSLPGKVFSDHVFAGRWSFQILCFDFGR